MIMEVDVIHSPQALASLHKQTKLWDNADSDSYDDCCAMFEKIAGLLDIAVPDGYKERYEADCEVCIAINEDSPTCYYLSLTWDDYQGHCCSVTKV